MKRPRTLVARLGWWFAVSLLALYGVPAALVYVYASAQARQYAVLTLKSEAEALAVYAAERDALDAPELSEPEEAPIPMWLRVSDDSTVLAQTPGTPPLPPVRARAGDPVVEVRFLPGSPAYVVVRHAVGGSHRGRSVEAIGSMRPLDRARRRLGVGLALVGVVLIPVASLGGRRLARRALRPIGDLVEAIRALDPELPQGRLRLPEGVVEEVAVLSRSFNLLLGRLEDTVERMRRFTADASHEIRNPLTVLRTGLEVALRRERSPAEYERLLRENLEEIDRLHAVVEGSLLLARGRELKIQRSTVDIEALVAAAVTFFTGFAAERGVRFEVEVDPDLTISGDAALLRLALFNLLDNAIKHSPRGASVRISARLDGASARLAVADRGPGVSDADRDRVFERYFRGGPASGVGVGGLGLSVVRWVAEAHGGNATLLARDPGQSGATFEIRLPLGA